MNQYRIRRGGSLLAGGSVAALGLALTLSSTGLVRSQPAAPAPAAAAQPALRDDQVQLVVKALSDAESHGFRSGEFALGDADEMLNSSDPAARQRGQARLQRAIVAYAQAQHGRRVAPADFLDDWGIKPATYDAAADFNFALKQDRLAQWLASLPPPFERYRDLRVALAQYRAIAGRGGWTPIAEGPALKPGMTDPRVIQLRRRLAAENPAGSIELNSPLYDPQLAAIVAAAQRRYGLEDDSIIGPAALRAFNQPVEARIEQIAANLERWRWMPRQWPTTRLEVNIAAAHLDIYDQNKPVNEMKVVVGAPDTKTPMLMSEIHTVVFNPPWNVPTSIATKELLPKGPEYLARKGFTWVSNGNGGSRLQQKPGPGNSLGRIKFDFNNSYGVYLHDTDARTAFGRDARSISHGCVRVERPEDLANMLLGLDSRWSPERLDQVLADTTTVRASLPEKIPVILAYWTVFTSPDGQVNFRSDQYEWDDKLSAMLKLDQAAA